MACHFKLSGVRESAKLEVAPDDGYRVCDDEKNLFIYVSVSYDYLIKLYGDEICD